MLDTIVLARAAKDLTLPVLGVAAVGAVGVASYTLYQWLKDGPFTQLSDLWTAIKNPIDTAKGWASEGGVDEPGDLRDWFAGFRKFIR